MNVTSVTEADLGGDLRGAVEQAALLYAFGWDEGRDPRESCARPRKAGRIGVGRVRKIHMHAAQQLEK